MGTDQFDGSWSMLLWVMTTPAHGPDRRSELRRPPLELIVGIVCGLADPEPVEQDREFARDRDDRALLRILPAALRDGDAIPPQVTVGAERAEDVLRRADQQSSAEFIARLRDAQLRGRIATLVQPRH